MNPKERRFELYLEDMMTSIDRIGQYTVNCDFNSFCNSTLIVDAVVRNFEIIGEAAKNIPEEIKRKYNEVPWKKMYGLRNLVSHVYFGIDYEMIWEIIKNDLPQNKNDLQSIIERESDNNSNNNSE